MIQKDIDIPLCEVIKNDIEDVYLAQWVEKINSHNHLDHRLLIFSDSGLALCRPKAFSKVPEITKFFSWFNLRNVELTDMTFKFSFENEEKDRVISFTFDKTSELLNVLCQHLANILIPSEYPKLAAGTNFKIEKFSTIPMISGLSRLKANIFFDNEVNDEIRSLFDTYSNFIYSGMTKLNLGLFGESRFIGIIIDSLNVSPHVTSVVFPSSKTSPPHWLEFCDLLMHSRYIKEVTTHEAITKDFYNISKIQQSDLSQSIESIIFGNQQLSGKEIDAIASLYKKSSFKKIKFIKAKSAMLSFKNNLNIFLNSSNFKSVTLDKIPGLQILTTLNLLRNVENIGITGCDIEISEAIPVICSFNGVIKTKSIDLSNNYCFFPLSRLNSTLPDCINEMYFDNVKFSWMSLQVLLSYFECQKCSNKLAVHINSISNVDLDKEFYKSFFKFAQKFSHTDTSLVTSHDKSTECFNLDKIYFDNNKISKYLLRFFARNDDLSLLSINGSDFESDDQIIPELCSLIKHTKSLKELGISGNLRFQLSPEKLELIIQSFARDQRSIKRLDISLHNYRPESLDVLSNVLLSNRKIEYVNFSRNNVYKKSAWISFFKKLMERGTPLDFETPHAELCEMLRLKEISRDDLVEMMEMIGKIKKGNKQIKIPPETINPTPIDDDEGAGNSNVSEDKGSNNDINEAANNNNFVNKQNLENKDESKFRWEINDIPMPMVNNTSIYNSFEKEFGFDALLTQIKS